MDPADRPVVLVTGAARRIGRVIARSLHVAGYDIALHHRGSRNEAEQLACELEARREGSTLLLQAELADPATPDALVRQAVQRFRRLDALVNNASTFYPTPIGATTQAQWDELFASNARAPYFLAQAAAPHLKRARGAIVNLIDIHATRPLARHPVYCMAKAALAMATLALAKELAPEVRVNGVSPGAVLWPESGKSSEEQQALVARTALRRIGTPEELAAAVLFLLRDATFVTGQILSVDGGRTLGS
ncbi:MAG TPA: pteridine reductase [Candidatus Saccharimonadia bacterium]|nr:pteridine reductase [Candidatus Saccharimonadia bacterium]